MRSRESVGRATPFPQTAAGQSIYYLFIGLPFELSPYPNKVQPTHPPFPGRQNSENRETSEQCASFASLCTKLGKAKFRKSDQKRRKRERRFDSIPRPPLCISREFFRYEEKGREASIRRERGVRTKRSQIEKAPAVESEGSGGGRERL